MYFPEINTENKIRNKSGLLTIIKNKDIKTLLLSAFVISFCLNLFLFIYPLSWEYLQVPVSKYWIIYLTVLLPSGLFVYPYIKYSEKKGDLRNATKLGFVFLVLCFISYLLDNGSRYILLLAGTLFFLGHTMYQSLLPTFLTQRLTA